MRMLDDLGFSEISTLKKQEAFVPYVKCCSSLDAQANELVCLRSMIGYERTAIDRSGLRLFGSERSSSRMPW